MPSLRERAIAEYHELLAADETLTPATFEKLRSAMRKNRLLYGGRPISVALRPHFLERSQFEAHKATAELIALRDEYRSAGNLRFFEQMKKMLIDEPDQPSQAQVATELGDGQRTRSNKPLSISSALLNIISTGDCSHSRHTQRIEDELRDLLLQSGRNLC